MQSDPPQSSAIEQNERNPRPPAWTAVLEHLAGVEKRAPEGLFPLTYDGRTIDGRDCWVYRAATPAFPFPVALKLYKPGTARPFAIRKQLQRHRACAESMKHDAGYSVPEPIAGFPDRRVIIMEWIDGPSVRDLMRSMVLNRSAYRGMLLRAGKWLAHFHAASTPKCEPLSVVNLLDRIEHRVTKSHPRIVAEAAYIAADNTIRELAVLLDGREMEHVEVHGDFTPSNLLVDKDRIAGIDFGTRRRLPHYYDICRFLVHLEAQRPAPKWLGAHPESFAAEAFLEGYGDGAPKATGDIMNYMMLTEVMRRWAAVGASSGTIPLRLLRTIETRRLRAMAVSLTKALR